MMQNLLPLVRDYGIFMNVLEDLHLVSAAIDVESVLVPYECVVCPGFWHRTDSCADVAGIHCGAWWLLSNFIPLLFRHLILK